MKTIEDCMMFFCVGFFIGIIFYIVVDAIKDQEEEYPCYNVYTNSRGVYCSSVLLPHELGSGITLQLPGLTKTQARKYCIEQNKLIDGMKE